MVSVDKAVVKDNNSEVVILPHANIKWKDLRLRKRTREFLQFVSSQHFPLYIKYIVLFGSEARGMANVKSDIDIAIISDRPLKSDERASLDEIIHDCPVSVNYQLVFTTVDKLITAHKLDVNFSINKQGVILYARK